MYTSRRVFVRALLAGAYGLSFDLEAAIGSAAEATASPPGATLGKDIQVLIAGLAEAVIPATSTVGAREAQVDRFIALVVERGMPPPDRERFLKGAAAFESEAVSLLGKRFNGASAAERERLVDTLDGEAFSGSHDAQRADLVNFFVTVKQLTVVGYYTSEAGAKAELEYTPMPGLFIGSVPVNANTRTYYEDSFGVPLERPLNYGKSDA